MWLALSFASALMLGFYDVAKKASLRDNPVLTVLFLNTLFSTILFSPFIVRSLTGADVFTADITLPHAHGLVMLKAVIVLTSWLFGYAGIKHLPITIVGPINATRPVLVLVGAMLVFGERLNLWQWAGVLLAVLSFFLLSLSGRKEKIDFLRSRWIWCVVAAAVVGAVSGLYDKYVMKQLPPIFVQSWFNFYQMLLMGLLLILMHKGVERFHWRWSIPLISIFISCADFCYLTALSEEGSMLSVVSLIRRGSVIVSFISGAMIFKEKNLKSKALDLALVLLGMLFIWIGSR